MTGVSTRGSAVAFVDSAPVRRPHAGSATLLERLDTRIETLMNLMDTLRQGHPHGA
jgi:hypothetical protein